jgi:hypothetical protein
MPSLEFRNLKALQGEPTPEFLATRAGDLWHVKDKDNRLEYVMLVMGHKKRGRHRHDGHTYVFMYHWGKASLLAKPCDLRDNDGNAMAAEASLISYKARGDKVRYLGNLFEMLPLSELLT